MRSDLLEKHIIEFSECQVCPLGTEMSQGKGCFRVFYRGSVPCKFLFVGEGPGDSELDVGQPFVGPSGKLLNTFIAYAMPKAKVGFTNAVVCAPRNSPIALLRTPKKSEINACCIRLKSLIDIVTPKCLIAVGNSGEHALKKLELPYEKIVHPAYILRKDGDGDGEIVRKKTLTQLKEIAEAYA